MEIVNRRKLHFSCFMEEQFYKIQVQCAVNQFYIANLLLFYLNLLGYMYRYFQYFREHFRDIYRRKCYSNLFKLVLL